MSNTLKNQTLQDGSFLGTTDLTDVQVQELSVLGPLKFVNLIVVGDTDIMGPVRESQNGTFNNLSVLGSLEAERISCTSLDVAGSVKVAGLVVTGDTKISGVLEMTAQTDPKFSNKLQNLDVSAESMTLIDTHVEGDITVYPTLINKALKWFNKDAEQVLHLAGQTVVKGNITFISGKGKILQDTQAKVEGTISGVFLEAE